MASEKQITANKLNAQKSTGPRTESGKAAAAGNAVKHGITAKKFLRPGEDPAEAEGIYEALREVHQPEDAFMENLVMQLTMSHYRTNRALRAEAEHSPLSGMLYGDHDDRVKNLGAYAAMIRKDIKQIEQSLADHKERRAARKVAASPVMPVPVVSEAAGDTLTAPQSGPARESPGNARSGPDQQNQKTKPISAGTSQPSSDATRSTGGSASPAVAPASPTAPAAQPAPAAAAAPSTDG